MASLLLRLFNSDYFSPHLALSYLKTYSDNIGITYYIVHRLRTQFPPEEVEFYWPQLCHLLISRPSKSRALESFILERCDDSVHVALLTLWYLQAALSDLSSNAQTASFRICQRVFNQCQRILFDDPLSATAITSRSASSARLVGSRLMVTARSLAVEKVQPWNIGPAVVGIGVVLASVPGMPSLASEVGHVAIEQGRAKPEGLDRSAIEGLNAPRGNEEDSDEEASASSEDGGHMVDDDEGEHSGDEQSEQANASRRGSLAPINGGAVGSSSGRPPTPPPKPSAMQPAPTASAMARSHTSASSTTSSPIKSANPFSSMTNLNASLAASFNDMRGKAAAAVNDVFGQSFITFVPGPTPERPTPPNSAGPTPAWYPQRKSRRSEAGGRRSSQYGSVPNLNASNSFASTATLAEDPAQQAELVLAQYDTEARRRLLRSNYCRSQTQFLLTLQDISARLLLIPKPARLSALRAELTALNHRLPAEVCFPLWCRAEAKEGQEAVATSIKPSQARRTRTSAEERHHRVVRINPSEAVVLNSADRVPFLLHVEVLDDDLDFDPERRQNRESLKKLVVQEDTRRRNFALSRSFALGDASRDHVARDEASGEEVAARFAVVNSESHSNDPSRPETPAAEKAKNGVAATAATTVTAPANGLARNGVSSSASASPPKMLAPPRTDSPAMPGGGEDEEIDLTEQAYGSDLAAFGEEAESGESDEEDLSHMNKTHDAAAWSQAPSAGASPQRPRHEKVPSNAGSATTASRSKDFSLDEYSERMRTAAIMLAQLDKSAAGAGGQQPPVVHNPHVSATAQGGWSSWIIGTSWAGATPKKGAGTGSGSDVGQGSAGVKAPLNGAGSGGGEAMPVVVRPGPSATAAHAAGGSSKLVPTDTEAIRKRIMQEMMALEEERMQRMRAGGRTLSKGRRKGAGNVEDEETVMRAVNKDDPSAAMFRESWAAKKARIRSASPYGHLASWDVFSVIVKTGADLRQEQLAVQLIQEFSRIWTETNSKCWVRYFRILVTSESSGLMETVTDAISIHSIKKEAYSHHDHDREGKLRTYSLMDHFVNTYGDPSSAKFAKARERFIESLAGYSIISYLLQVKDRHNGNILVDGDGRLIHIDFGFMLGISPGGVGFEAAPFKMPQEYIDIIGGVGSPKWEDFKSLMRSGFRDIRKHAERIIMIVELMQKDSKLPCFVLGDLTSSNLRDRFQLALSQSQCDEFVDRLIMASAGSAFTALYDRFQYYTQGVL